MRKEREQKDLCLGKGTQGLFSVIMATYNRADLITASLDSVWKQHYRPIEMIIVDDGSFDLTRDVVCKWIKTHSGDGFAVNSMRRENGGQSAARNSGLRNCNGEFIQYLDSDDLLHPQRLEVIASKLQDEGADFINTGFEGFCAVCGECTEIHYGKPHRDQLELALIGRLWPNTLRCAFRRSLAEKIGLWNEKMGSNEDTEYVYRALLVADKPIAVRKALAKARRGGRDRINDRIRTKEGRQFRLQNERILVNGIQGRSQVADSARCAFASRLYALGLRSYASGWPDIGRECGELAFKIETKLDRLGKRRRLVWSLGPAVSSLYVHLHHFKCSLLGKPLGPLKYHKCSARTER